MEEESRYKKKPTPLADFYEDGGDQLAGFRRMYGGAHLENEQETPFSKDRDVMQAAAWADLCEKQPRH